MGADSGSLLHPVGLTALAAEPEEISRERPQQLNFVKVASIGLVLFAGLVLVAAPAWTPSLLRFRR